MKCLRAVAKNEIPADSLIRVTTLAQQFEVEPPISVRKLLRRILHIREKLEQISVLPVFLVPTDQLQFIPDPFDEPIALDRITNTKATDFHDSFEWDVPHQTHKESMNLGTYYRFFERAKKNLSAHLKAAQEKYGMMLKDATGKDCGTFQITSWNYRINEGEIYDRFQHTDIEPYIFQAPQNLATYAEQLYGKPTYEVWDHLCDEFGYSQDNCPYIFLVIFVSDPRYSNPLRNFPHPAGGRPFKDWTGGIGGYIQINYPHVATSHIGGHKDNKDMGIGRHFLSILLHELGHCFMRSHVPEAKKYTSNSVMSQNPDNWIEGCVMKSSAVDHTYDYYCEFDYSPMSQKTVQNYPGILESRDIDNLKKNNKLAFPDFETE